MSEWHMVSFISKASNLSLSFFLSVQDFDSYNATLQSIVFITFFFRSSLWKDFTSFIECVLSHCNSTLNLCCTSIIVWDERSKITKLVRLLYYLPIYRYVDRVVSFSFAPVSADSLWSCCCCWISKFINIDFFSM